jgi:hypothetical protein
MGTGGKIAIGCGIAVLVGGIVAVLALGGAIFWAKGKVDQVAGEQARIEEARSKANANTFVEPERGLIQEDRLLKLIEVRRRVYTVYVKHKDDIESLSRQKEADFQAVRKSFNILNEVRLAQAQAQAELGMSDDEYRFMVQQVYKSAWASASTKEFEGKTMSEAARDGYDRTLKEMEKAAEALGKNQDPQLQKTAEAARQSAEQLRQNQEAFKRQAQQFDVPAENIALFRSHEAEIKKYAMNGLELLGL